ncbi:MAG: SRPBCC family protein [Tepidisphaeraceae bacterium]
MKITLIILGVVVVIVAVVFLIGMMLPQKHSASRTARYRQKPQAIFDAIMDWRNYPGWRSDLKSVRERAGAAGHVSWVEVDSMGERPIEIVESDPPRRIVGLIADPDHKLFYGGTWTYDIKPTSDGCDLTITEDGEVYPALFRFMARFIFGYTGTMEAYHKALSKKFGQEVQFVEG